jgi:hypothetical protein
MNQTASGLCCRLKPLDPVVCNASNKGLQTPPNTWDTPHIGGVLLLLLLLQAPCPTLNAASAYAEALTAATSPSAACAAAAWSLDASWSVEHQQQPQ